MRKRTKEFTGNGLRIDDAIKIANENGKAITAYDIITLCWPDRTYKSAWDAFDRLATGRCKTVNIDILRRLCEITGVSTDFLLGI